MARHFLTFAVATMGFMLAWGVPGAPVRAQSLDPFATKTDTDQWKSFDRYKEEEKERLFSIMTGNPDEDAKAAAKAEAEEEQKPETPPETKPPSVQAAGQATPPASGEPAIAPPERPLALPVMPGMNGGFDVRVGSTEDDVKPAAKIVDIDDEPKMQLPKQDWLDAPTAAKEEADGTYGLEDHTPLHVRMSFLPGFEAPRTKEAAKLAAAPPKPVVLPKSAADVAACAAIDAYKKRQLEAIQSDRATLAALQDAIKQLGLEQKLDFMAGAGSKMNTAADAPSLVNLPAAAPPALPPVSKP